MAFNIREFLKKGFIDAIGKMADYQIILNAMGYLDKGILTMDDLAEIQAAIDEHNAPPVPVEPDIPEENYYKETSVDSDSHEETPADVPAVN